jgi:hypothetical protein
MIKKVKKSKTYIIAEMLSKFKPTVICVELKTKMKN